MSNVNKIPRYCCLHLLGAPCYTKAMTIEDWLKQSTRQLAINGITTARLDALVLLEDCLSRDRALLLAHPEQRLTAEQILVLGAWVARRAAHEPLSYIRGRTEFYGRLFRVDKHVLQPRPESETIIDMLKKLVQTDAQITNWRIADIGTGSGALAITAKLELAATTVAATDIDPACLLIARQNATALGADVEFLEGDLLQPLLSALKHLSGTSGTAWRSTPTILLCNLPYVPEGFPINQAASSEPRLALFGGTDGLDVYRKLFTQLTNSLGQYPVDKPYALLTESLPKQHRALADIAARHGYMCMQTDDFIQLFRPANE
jgi:release factor glutamine methyltransferase